MTSGQIVSRLGTRTAIIWSLLFAALALVAVGIGSSIGHSFVFVLAALVCFGVGSGCCNVAMNVEAADVERATGRPMMPLFHASFSVGGVAGALIAAAAAALHVGVIVNVSITSVLMTAVAVAIAPRLPAVSRVQAEVGLHASPVLTQFSVWFEKRTVLIGVLVLTTSFVAGSGSDWLSLALVDGHDTSATLGAIAYGAFVVARTAIRLAGVTLLSKFGRVAVLRCRLRCRPDTRDLLLQPRGRFGRRDPLGVRVFSRLPGGHVSRGG